MIALRVVANGSRSTQWLTEDEGKCCEKGCERGFACVTYVSVSRFSMSIVIVHFSEEVRSV